MPKVKKAHARTKGLRDPDAPPFGFAEWNLDAREKFLSLIDDMIREGIELATEEYECTVYIKDTDLKIILPLGSSDDDFENGIGWTFKLADIVTDEIELYEAGDKGPITDEEDREHLLRLKAMFGKFQDQIDEALAR